MATGGMQGTVVGGVMVELVVVMMHGGSVVDVVELVGPVVVVMVVGGAAVVVVPDTTVLVVVLGKVVVVVPGAGAPGQPNDCKNDAKSPDTPGKPAKETWSDATSRQMGPRKDWSSWATAARPPTALAAAIAG